MNLQSTILNAGFLQKIRRISQSDGIFAATGALSYSQTPNTEQVLTVTGFSSIRRVFAFRTVDCSLHLIFLLVFRMKRTSTCYPRDKPPPPSPTRAWVFGSFEGILVATPRQEFSFSWATWKSLAAIACNNSCSIVVRLWGFGCAT
jgi:hypothetical protein